MAFATKLSVLGATLILAFSLPGISRADDDEANGSNPPPASESSDPAPVSKNSISGTCSQDPDNPPARGQSGSIKVVTSPEKAVVYLGGIKLGPSPIDTSFTTGRHTLTIMLNGEELVNERINICAGGKTEVQKKLLLPYGSVTIKTNPLNCNCKIKVDGEEAGSTKGGVLTINHLEAGTRVLKISNGKRTKEMQVNILPEETVMLNVDFKK